MEIANPTFQELTKDAQTDPHILAFWLDGSRGKGLETKHSDYDCTMIVEDDVAATYKQKYEAFGYPQIECKVRTLDEFKRQASWGAPDAWNRYNYAYLKPLIDKTGSIQEMMNSKARVPENEIRAFIEGSLDHYINQVYRSIKCTRDGTLLGARLEAAESIAPLLDALFALHDRRLKPYYKYLEWELEAHPLSQLPWDAKTFLTKLLSILEAAPIPVQQEILQETEKLFRGAGYDSVFDSWKLNVPWMLDYRE
jgi:hypothetical protein